MYNESTINLITPWNRAIKGIYREGRSDANTLISCIQEDEYKLQKHNLQPGMIGIDLGAHIGGATLAMCSLGMRVIAVEILPENVSLIHQNLFLNGYDAKVINAGISNVTGNIISAWRTAPTDSTGYIHEFIGTTIPHEQLSSLASDGEEIKISTVALSDILNSVDHCHFLKVDCEGAEWEAFDCDLSKVDIISGELHSINGSILSHGDLLPSGFIDITEEFEPTYSKPGLQTHFVYKRLST